MPINPTISKKTEVIFTLNESAKKLFQVIYREKNSPEAEEEVPKIKVSELISRLAFYYEKIRNSVDYKEDYLLRKSAILRILKRQIIIEGQEILKVEEIAKNILIELIRAGYLPNNKLPETKISELALIIGKYLKLRRESLAKAGADRQKREVSNWILAVASAEIEEKLCVNPVLLNAVSNMYELLSRHIALPADSIYGSDKDIQIYLSIHKIFMKFDNDMLEFLLLKYFHADWVKASDEKIKYLAAHLEEARSAIGEQMEHPLTAQVNKIVSHYAVYYRILNDVVTEDPVRVYEEIREDQKAFPRLVKRFAQKRYAEARKKLRRAAVRSIIYIFLTKMILAVILEVPVTVWLGEIINYNSLAVNIAFPPLLLFLIVLFTRMPSEANTLKIIRGVEEIIFKEKEKKEPIILRRSVKRKKGISGVFAAIYAVTFFITFSLVMYLLDRLHFNFVSIIIFLFFLTLVSFFSMRIRKVAREMYLVESKENIFSFIVDFFYVPIIEVGKWLNEKFSRINFFIFILDFIIEAPFKVFVDIAEDWTKYVKERKEEIM